MEIPTKYPFGDGENPLEVIKSATIKIQGYWEALVQVQRRIHEFKRGVRVDTQHDIQCFLNECTHKVYVLSLLGAIGGVYVGSRAREPQNTVVINAMLTAAEEIYLGLVVCYHAIGDSDWVEADMPKILQHDRLKGMNPMLEEALDFVIKRINQTEGAISTPDFMMLVEEATTRTE